MSHLTQLPPEHSFVQYGYAPILQPDIAAFLKCGQGLCQGLPRQAGQICHLLPGEFDCKYCTGLSTLTVRIPKVQQDACHLAVSVIEPEAGDLFIGFSDAAAEQDEHVHGHLRRGGYQVDEMVPVDYQSPGLFNGGDGCRPVLAVEDRHFPEEIEGIEYLDDIFPAELVPDGDFHCARFQNKERAARIVGMKDYFVLPVVSL